MSAIVTIPSTGERLDTAYDTLMTVLDLAATIERACAGAIDWDGQQLKNAVESIGRSTGLLERLVGEAAEEVEMCKEYGEARRKWAEDLCAELDEPSPSEA